MTSLDVLLYGDNPQGIPAAWPAQTQVSRSESPGAGWLRMTGEEFAAYCAQHRPAYDAWEASLPPPPAPSPSWSTLDFLLRFTAAERAAIRNSPIPEVADFADLLRASGEVQSDHPLLGQGMGLLVLTGLLTAERSAQILSSDPSP